MLVGSEEDMGEDEQTERKALVFLRDGRANRPILPAIDQELAEVRLCG